MIKMRLVPGAPPMDLQRVLEIAYDQQCENNKIIEMYGFLPFVIVPAIDIATMMTDEYGEDSEARTATGATDSRCCCGVCFQLKSVHTSKQVNECFNRFIEGIN